MRQRTNRMVRAGLIVGNQALNSVANLAISLFLVRALGVAEFGIYAVYFAIAYGISAVINALISSPLVSIASQKAPAIRDAMILSASIAIAAASFLLLLLALGLDLIFWTFVGSKHTNLLAVAFGISMAASEFARRASFLHGSANLAWRFDLIRFGSLVIAFTMARWLSATETIESYVALFAGANVLGIIALVAPNLAASMKDWNRRRIASHIAHFIRSGRWLSLSSLLQLASDHALLLVTAFVAGAFAAGAIKTCQTIVGIVNPVLMALEHTMPKKLGEDIRRHGSERAALNYRRTSILTLLVMASALGFVALGASPILRFVSGGELKGYEHLLRLCCALWLMYPATLMLTFIFRARNRTLQVLFSQAVAAVFALVVGIPLIIKFGAYGAVLGTIVAQATAVAALLLISRRGEPFPAELKTQ